jgi:hypothetical protein
MKVLFILDKGSKGFFYRDRNTCKKAENSQKKYEINTDNYFNYALSDTVHCVQIDHFNLA